MTEKHELRIEQFSTPNPSSSSCYLFMLYNQVYIPPVQEMFEIVLSKKKHLCIDTPPFF